MLRFHRRRLCVPATLIAAMVAIAAGCERPARSQRKMAVDSAELGVPQASPGGEPYGDALRHRLAQALAGKGPGYRPRTRHLAADGSPLFTNRLIEQSSPYLLQHAHNPVNWYPWGDAAFADARRLGRPILLSVGYSTCHWCHVMERESFEDLEIAEFLNAQYIPIKVDREERPDIDAVYMEVVQGMTGSGGWPMTVLLTPDGHPFFAGTYFPARDGDRGAPTGFLTLLKYYAEAYARSPDDVTAHAAEIVRRLQEAAPERSAGTPPGADVIEQAVQQFARGYDAVEGGFGGAPKFPRSAVLELLMHYHRRRNDAHALAMVTHTLEKMAAGGIHDHIGGGFHRYSTDARWLVPHFEKMLYDNALLASAYLDAYQLTARADFADVVREILDYVLRDMTDTTGGFASATDADSPGPDGEEGEGLYFTWTPAEVEAVVGTARAPLVESFFGVRHDGPVEGRSVVHVATGVDAVAGSLGIAPDVARREIEQAKRDMARARGRRLPPAKDTKIITAWNGLMISALARAARVLDTERYARAAARAARFILSDSMHDGRLARSWSAGSARHQGVLDDYAFFVAGLLDLFEATQDPHWLAQAAALQVQLRKHFWDSASGGFYLTPDDGERLLTREKPTYDGALPSGNAVAIVNLLRLYELTSRDEYRRDADSALSAFAPLMERAPTAVPRMLCALDWFLDRPKQVVIVTGDRGQAGKPFLDVLADTYLPNAVLVIASRGRDRDEMERLVPLLEEKTTIGGKTTAYVCEREVCKLPTSDPATFRAQIRTVAPLQP